MKAKMLAMVNKIVVACFVVKKPQLAISMNKHELFPLIDKN